MYIDQFDIKNLKDLERLLNLMMIIYIIFIMAQIQIIFEDNNINTLFKNFKFR